MDIALFIGDKIFFAEFYKNEVSDCVKKMFPLTFQTEKTSLNAKDFFAPLPCKITADSKPAQSIITGDILVCNSVSISVCVKNYFTTDSEYTKIAHVKDPHELEDAIKKNKGIIKFDFYK